VFPPAIFAPMSLHPPLLWLTLFQHSASFSLFASMR
jgi:hypothetical protein